MNALAAFLALVSTVIPPASPAPLKPTQSNYVEQKDAGLVRDALAVFYKECGFYPDDLQMLFQATESQPSCLHGTKQAPLKATPQMRDVVSRLEYTPFGYDDFEIAMKLFWTRDDGKKN